MRKFLAIVGSVWLAGHAAAAEPSVRRPGSTVPTPGASAPAQPNLMDCIPESHREAVAAVVKAPTLTTKADEEFVAGPKMYDWLLEHPDRASLAWQRLKVPCLDIVDQGKGVFKWTEETGSELTWQTVGRFEHGSIWYATGKVKAGTLIPSVPVKAVAVLHAPRAVDADGLLVYKPVLQLYLQTDSKVAATLMRSVGPAAPKMAEQGAEQLLFFFSGLARYAHKKPEQAEATFAPKK